MEKIIAFGLNKEKMLLLRKIIALQNIQIIEVEPKDYKQVIGDLYENKRNLLIEEMKERSVPGESLLLLCGFTQNRLDDFLAMTRQNKLLVDYKAILTQTNIYWTGLQLFAEMAMEKNAYEMQKKQDDKDE